MLFLVAFRPRQALRTHGSLHRLPLRALWPAMSGNSHKCSQKMFEAFFLSLELLCLHVFRHLWLVDLFALFISLREMTIV